MSVCLRGTTGTPLDGFSWNLIRGYFFRKAVDKIPVTLNSNDNNRHFTCRPICVQFWSYLAQLLLEWEMLQTKVVQKIKTHVFLRKSYRLRDWNFCPDRFVLSVFSAMRSGRKQNVVSGVCVWYQHLATNCSAVRVLRLLSFGVWRRVVGWVLPGVSKDGRVCLLQAAGPSSTLLGMIDPEEDGVTIGWNIRSYSPTSTLSHAQQYRCDNLKCRAVHYSSHADAQTDTRDEANGGISANICCKRSENIILRGAFLCVFKVANMASERNL